MKKVLFAVVTVAVALCSCGGSKSGGSSSGSGSESSSGLADGKWPAAIYDKYDIPEIETKGQIVYTQFEDTEGPYQYAVYYNGVTKEEMQAYVKKLQEKGYRTPKYTQERIDAGRRDADAFLFQPGEQEDKRLRIQFDFEHPMAFEYYADEPNPAFVVKKAENEDEEDVIEYNFTVSLSPMKNKVESEGSFEALGVKAGDLAGIPNVRVVRMDSGPTGGSITIHLFSDHQIAEGDFDAIHDKLADVFEAKGLKFFHAMSGKEYTAEQLKADKVRSYILEKDGKKFLMMGMTDDRIGDFGGGITYRFMISNR